MEWKANPVFKGDVQGHDEGATMSASELLAEMGIVFGQEFIEAVTSEFDSDDLDEEEMVGLSKKGAKLVRRHKKRQKKIEKGRHGKMKAAMAAIARSGERYGKKRKIEKERRGRAEFEKEQKKAEVDPDAVKKALSDLRAMRKGKKDEPKKDKLKKTKGGGAGARAGAAKASAGGGGGGSGQERAKQKGAAGSGAKGQHYPFRNSPNLGKGPGTPPGFPRVHGSRHHDQKKCWNCDCGPIYTAGCLCKSTGADPEKCPKGRTKHVKIRKDYRDAYNKMYHAWRAKKGGAVTARLKGGGRPGGF